MAVKHLASGGIGQAGAAGRPERCSGIPVQRSSAEDLLALLGEQFTAVAAGRLRHRTPGGDEQPFTRLTARRDGLPSRREQRRNVASRCL